MIAKVINSLRNGYLAHHLAVSIKDASFCIKILDILWRENLIRGYQKTKKREIKVYLKYHEGSPICTRLAVVSRPSDRVYLSVLDLHRVSTALGVLIVSTPEGVMISEEAVRKGFGGEILAYAS